MTEEQEKYLKFYKTILTGFVGIFVLSVVMIYIIVDFSGNDVPKSFAYGGWCILAISSAFDCWALSALIRNMENIMDDD